MARREMERPAVAEIFVAQHPADAARPGQDAKGARVRNNHQIRRAGHLGEPHAAAAGEGAKDARARRVERGGGDIDVVAALERVEEHWRRQCLRARGAVRIGPGEAHELERLALQPLFKRLRLRALLIGPQAVLLDEHSTILSVLRLVAVGKRYGARTVLNRVSLEVHAGEYVAIIGESGIGKSTLLNVIAGLEPVDEGQIFFGGQELTRMEDDALTLLRRDRYGFVFQAFHVLPQLTVEQNVALPLLLRGVSDAPRVRSMIAAVGLAGREASTPRELSGGELQRVAIARALVGEPSLVLADEPTGNLDPENARQVLALFRQQTKERGAAAILATHSEAAAAGCDRRYRLTSAGLAPLP